MDDKGRQYLELLEYILELKSVESDNINSRIKNIYIRVSDYIEETSDLFEEFLNHNESEDDDDEEGDISEDDGDEEDPYQNV